MEVWEKSGANLKKHKGSLRKVWEKFEGKLLKLIEGCIREIWNK